MQRLINNHLESSMERARIGYLDAMKCVGTILVIEGHIMGFGMNHGAYDSLAGQMFYSFNMPMFFFVSGYLAFKYSKYSTKEILRGVVYKFSYLVLPTLIFVIYRYPTILSNPLSIIDNGIGGYWFPITLWECFVLYYTVLLLFKNSLMRSILLIVMALCGVVLLSLCGEFGPKLLDMNRLTKYFHFFVLGIMAMKYKFTYERLINCEWLKMITTLAFWGLLFTVNYSFLPSLVFHFIRDIVLRYLGLFVVLSWFVSHSDLFNMDTKLNRVVLSIGRKSLPIYLLQYFFIPDLQKFGDIDILTAHIMSFMYTIVIIVICLLFISLLSNSMIIKKYFLGRK